MTRAGRVIRIGDVPVGDGQPCYIIAEAGVNHNGDPGLAMRLIEIAAASGVNAVKFQKRSIPDILVQEALDRPYTSETALGPTYGAHRQRIELPETVWLAMRDSAVSRGLHFLASGWDPKSVDFLDGLGVPAFKVASADLTNLPLLEHVAQKGKPVLLSTGMSTLEEIREAVQTVLPINPDLILLHCISSYPAEDYDLNLRMMGRLREEFGLPVGYSGHERGVAPTVAAVALGACVVERHFTVDRTMRGPDHAASLEPQGLQRIVKYARTVEAALGRPEKVLLDSELPIRAKLAKSVVSACRIPKGAVIEASMLTVKGPGTGLAPKHRATLVGRTAREEIPPDTLLPPEALDW